MPSPIDPSERRPLPRPAPTKPKSDPSPVSREPHPLVRATADILERAAAKKPPATKPTPQLERLPNDHVGMQLAATSGRAAASAQPSSGSTWNFVGKTQPTSSNSLTQQSLNAREHETNQQLGIRQYVQDGVAHTERTVSNPDGSSVVTTSFYQDGVSNRQQVRSEANGDRYIQLEQESKTQKLTTVTAVESVAGNVEDYVDLGEFEAPSGERGSTVRTTSQTSILDKTHSGAKPVLQQSSISYAQSASIDPARMVDDGRIMFDPPVRGRTPVVVEPSGPVQWDTSRSTQSISFNSTTHFDPQGSASETHQLSAEMQLVGVGSQGQAVSIDYRGEKLSDGEGRPLSFTSMTEEKGTISKESSIGFGSFDSPALSPDFQKRLAESDSPYIASRNTYSLDYTTGQEAYIQELGDYDRPDQDGRTVVRNSDGLNTTLSYRLVSEAGSHVQQQTVIPGTDYSNLLDTRYRPNGERTSLSTTTMNGQVLDRTFSSRDLLVEPGQSLPAAAPGGYNQAQWDEFRRQHPTGPVYRETLDSMVAGGPSQHLDISSSGSDRVGRTSSQQDGQSLSIQVMQSGDGQADFQFSNGSHFLIQPGGQQAFLDGEPIALTSFAVGSTSIASLGSSIAALQQAETTLHVSAEFSKQLSPLLAYQGYQDMLDANNLGERLGGAANLGYGIQGGLEAFGQAGGVASRVAGASAGFLNAGLGIYELTQRNFAEGSADAVAGGLAIAAAVFPGAAPVLLGGAALATLVRLGMDIGDGGPEQAELVI
ncbi:hypothetical protein JST97_03430 [bacterium]|nr:hypothetical protein [bacterium]